MHPRVLGVPIRTDAADGVARYADISPPGSRIVQKTVHTGNGKSPRCALLLSECIGAYRAGEYNPGSASFLLKLHLFICGFTFHDPETCNEPDEKVRVVQNQPQQYYKYSDHC